jgi:protein-S-isoprenylcysteine O-methyltransferase Ste14
MTQQEIGMRRSAWAAYTSVLVGAFMTNAQTETASAADRGHWPTTLASLAVGAGFFALWFWLLPSWLGFHVDIAGPARWRWIVAVPSMLGFAVALRCVWDFGRAGHGTPVPVAPPKKLVVVGFYRYVRNPMYLGFFTGWIGLWIVFGQANLAAIAVAFAVILGVLLFVRLYEEPTLRKMFGADYEEYCRNVHRWVPRMRSWEPAGRR